MNLLRPSRARFVIALLLPVLAVLAMPAPVAAQDDYYTLPIPCRYISRGQGNPFPGGGPAHVLPLSSFNCTIPADAKALVVNVVGIEPTADGELIVFPDALPTLEPVIPGNPPVARVRGSLPLVQGKNRAKIFTVEVGPGPAIRFVGIFPIEAAFHIEVNVLGYFLDPLLDLDTDNSAGRKPDFITSFVEDGGPVRVTDDVTVDADPDDTELDHVTITLTNRPDGAAETLAANVGSTGIVATYSSATGVLLLQGPATLADFDTVLETVTYDNTATTPNLTSRVITFVGNDGERDGSSVITTVTLPMITAIADQVIDEDTPTGSLAFNVRNTVVSVTATSSDQSIIPDANLVLGGSNPNRWITVTPAANAFGGPVTITVSVNDGTSTTTETFTVTVNAVNDPPSFTKGADVSVGEDAGTQTINSWATAISPGPANEASQTVSFNVTGNTNAALFSVAPAVSPTGVLTFTPALGATGAATITINLQDDGGTANGGDDTSDDQTFTITVNDVNDEPTFEATNPNQTVLEDAGAQTVNGWATSISPGPGEGTQTVNFLITGNSNTALFSAAPAISPTGVLTYTTAPNANGEATIKVVLQDNGGTAGGGDDTSPELTFTITVTAVNDAPEFTKGADQTILEGVGLQTVTGWATGIRPGPVTATDETAQLLTFQITGNTNSALFQSGPAISATGDLTYTPAADAFGTATLTVVLTDDGGTANGGADTSTPAQTFTITITGINDPPSFTAGPNVTVNEDSGAYSAAWATGISAGSNEGSQTVSFEITANDNATLFQVAPAVSSTGVLTFTPAANASGEANITLRIVDDGGTANGGVNTSATQTFKIIVNAINDVPSFTAGPDVVVNEDSGAYSAAWATAISAGVNEGTQTVSFEITGNTVSSLFSVAPAVSPAGVLTFTTAPNAFGTTTVTLRIKDDGGTANGGVDTSATQSFTITVNGVNDAPSFTAGAPVTVDEDSGPYSAAWATSVAAGPANEAGQTVSFQLVIDSVTPADLFSVAPSISSTGVLTFTSALNKFGSATITVTLQDNGGTANGGVNTSVSQNLTITVNSVPDPPVAGTDTFETFGNTELRVDLSAAATPHVLTDLTGASGVLNNDSDPIEMTPISITNVVGCGAPTAPFVCATANGGEVTLQADGSFSYLPPQANPAVTATDSTDSFQYTLTNGVGASAIGIVNLTRREVIWYVDPTAGAGGDGRSHSPFQSFASLNGVAGAGDLDNADDYILVHDGTFAGNASIELEAGQRLIGQGVGLSLPLGSLGTKVILPATTQPQISNASGDVIKVTSAVPARIAGLSLSGSVNAIDMQTTGAYSGSGTLAIENNTFRGAGAEGIDVNAGATGTVALNIQNNTWDVAGIHASNAIDIATTNGALRLDISNNTNVLSTGASAIVAGASSPGTLTITGFAGNSIHGNSALAGVSINQATFDSNLGVGGFQQVDGDNMSIGAGGNPVGSAGLSLTSVQGNLFFDDLDIYTGSGAGLQISGTGSGMTFSVTPAAPDGTGTSWIDADNGPAVDVSNAALDLRLARLESATTTSGLVLSSVSGQLRAPSGSSIIKSSGGGTAFSISSSSATVDYAGSLNITSGAGVALSGNTGLTSFSGGMLLSTGTNTAFSATGGGTVTVVDPPGLTNNTVTTTTGTALNISGTTIGGDGVTFESVTSTTAGANTAIILANTGSGPFLVAGTGSSGTGGTISNKSVDAMTMNNTDGSVTLRNMIIQDIGDLGGGLHTISGDDAIHAQQVDGGLTLENVIIRRISDQAIHGSLFAGGATVWNGLTITNSTIEDTNRFNVANTGDANNEGMIRILGIRGNVSITGSTLRRGGELIDFFVTDGTLNMTASANDFHTAYKEFTSGVTASVGGHCVDVTVQGAANADVRIGDRIDSGLANDFLNCRLGSVRVANDSGATGSVDVVIGRNTFTVNDHSSGIGGDFDFPQGGVLLMSRGTDAATFDVVIDGNYFDEITNASGGVGQVSYDMQNGNWQVLMEENTFDTPGNAPWYLRADSTASARVLFRNNVGIKGFFNCPDASCAGGYDGPGLRSLADLQNGALMDLTIIGDQFAEHDASFDPGQTFEARVLNTGGGGTLCLDLQNNRAPDGYSLEEFAGDLNLVGSGSCPAGTPSAGCQTLLGAKGNLGGSNVATTSPPFVNVAGTIDVVAAACQQPAGAIF